MPSHHRVAGLLLTGGSSHRMGRDKATIIVRGRSLADRAAALLSSVADPVVEVGAGVSGLPAVREPVPGEGPLAAMAAGGQELARLGHRGAAVVLGVDMPLVTRALLHLVATWPGAGAAVPIADGRPQVLCARYPATAFLRCAELVAEGERSLRALLADVSADWIPPESWAPVAGRHDVFDDADTPEDLARLLAVMDTLGSFAAPCGTVRG